jgi:hypothetical protein
MVSKIIRCACYGHVVTLDYDKSDRTLFISIMPAKTTFWQRLKYLLANKSYTCADVVFYEEQISELKKYINDELVNEGE